MVKIKRRILIITLILTFVVSLGIYVYINKSDKVVQAEEQVNVEEGIDNKDSIVKEDSIKNEESVVIERIIDNNKVKVKETVINKDTVESLTAKELFISCLKVSCNIADTSNAEEMKYITAFQKEKFRAHYVNDVMPNCYAKYKTISLKDYKIKEIKYINDITDEKSQITYNGFIVYYTATIVLDGKVEVWDNEAIITYENGKYLIATLKIR